MPASWNAPSDKTTGDVITSTIWNNLLGASGSLQYLYDNVPPAQFTWITKSATETVNNSSSLQNDDAFSFAVTANYDYLVECALAITTGTTPDWKFAWTLTNMTWDGTYEDAIGFGSAPTLISTQAITSGTGRAVTAAAAATSILWRATFHVHAGSSGGTLNFQWAQNTADASNTSVLKNSWMRYRQLGAT